MPNQSISPSAARAMESNELPHWDLSALFPSLDSPEFIEAFERLLADVDALSDLFDDMGIHVAATGQSESAPIAHFERALSALNAVERQVKSLESYLYGNVTTDSRNELAQARFSLLQERGVTLSKLQTRFTAWVGTQSVGELVSRSTLAAEHEFPLRQLHEAARYLMSEDEEALAMELAPSSGAAWSKLHDNLTSRITATVDIDGEAQTLPMSGIRNLAMHPDRGLRERAWRAELASWEGHALPIAAALNGVKGQVLALSERRGWEDPLVESLFWSTVSVPSSV